MATPMSTTYYLKRDQTELIRLSAQHLLLQLHTKYILHPDIPVEDGMSIADIGAGTGLWATELACSLPSAQVFAYDISSAHFPAPEHRPTNLAYHELDFFGEIPSSMIGQFDVVHIRAWGYIIRNNDPSTVIQNASRMLKPGGHLQWEEARFASYVVEGDAAYQTHEMLMKMATSLNFGFGWIEELDQSIQRTKAGLEVVDCQYRPFSKEIVPLVIETALVAFESTATFMDGLKEANPSLPSSEEFHKPLNILFNESRKANGQRLYWNPVTLLAKKTGDEI